MSGVSAWGVFQWRRALAACTVLAVGGLGLLALAPAGAAPGDPDAGRPSVWQGAATASGLEVLANSRPPPVILPEVLRDDVPYGGSSWSSSGDAQGSASSVYPGLGISYGPSLLCQPGVPCQPGFPPPFPLTANASYPLRQDDKATLSGGDISSPGAPLSGQVHSVTAHAGRDSVTTNAVVNGVDVAGGPSTSAASRTFRERAAAILQGPAPKGAPRPSTADTAAVHIDSVAGATRLQFAPGNRVAVSTSSVQFTGIRLLGDVVHVDSLVVTSTVSSDGKADEHVILGNVTVAGQPAQITDQGVTIGAGGPQSGALRQLDDALQEALKAGGAQLVLVGTGHHVEPQAVTSQAQGLLLYYEHDLRNIPSGAVYFASIELGNAGTSVAANDAGTGAAASGPTAIVGVAGDTNTLPGGGTLPSGLTDTGLATAGPGGLPFQTSAALPRPSSGARRFGGRLAVGDGLLGASGLHNRVTIIYLALTAALGALAVIAPRRWTLRALRRSRRGGL